MASIRKIQNKKGISYKIEVSNGYDVNGKKIRETTTFVPEPGMTMKQAEKDKRIRTAPKGAWESGVINEKEHRSKNQHINEITTDIQENGYPVSRKNQDD